MNYQEVVRIIKKQFEVLGQLTFGFALGVLVSKLFWATPEIPFMNAETWPVFVVSFTVAGICFRYFFPHLTK